MPRMIVKGVAFNPDDEDQMRLLAHAERRPNFSGYVKRLIQRDCEKDQDSLTASATELSDENEFDYRQMASLI